MLVLLILILLTSCSNQSNQSNGFEIVFSKDWDSAKFVPTTLEREYPVPDSSMFKGYFGDFLDQCTFGYVESGRVFISELNDDIFCIVVQVPQMELNTPFGLNLNRQRPVLEMEMEDILENKSFIIVDGTLSPQMQGLLLGELLLSRDSLGDEFYDALPIILSGMVDARLKEGFYWEKTSLEEAYEEIDRNTSQVTRILEEYELVQIGGTYSGIFGEKPVSEADAFQRGRLLQLSSAALSCQKTQSCSKEWFSNFSGLGTP